MEFKDRLKELRKRENLTQEELSKRSGLAIGTIRQYEAGKRKPEFDALLKIAAALGVDNIAALNDPAENGYPANSSSIQDKKTKKPASEEDGLDDLDKQLLEIIKTLSHDQKVFLLAQLQTLRANLEGR